MATSRAVLACALAASPALGCVPRPCPAPKAKGPWPPTPAAEAQTAAAPPTKRPPPRRSFPKLMQYQPREDVQTEARIDLDVEEILALLPSDGAADFDGAMAIYSSGGGNGAAATLKSLATPGSSTMAGDTWWPIYRAYWNSDNYADEFVTNTATLPPAMRKELIKKGSVYQGVWMHAVHNFDKGKRECDVVLWDKCMGYYVGSLLGEFETSADFASVGILIYSLAQALRELGRARGARTRRLSPPSTRKSGRPTGSRSRARTSCTTGLGAATRAWTWRSRASSAR